MSDDLTNEIRDTGGQLDASQRGVNPYAPDRITGMTKMGVTGGGSDSPYRSDAKGLDGDLIDAMMKGRWEEGRKVGAAEGHARAAASFQRVYDDGFRAGHTTGFQEADLAFSAEVLPVLQQAGATLAMISDKTGSKAIKEAAIAQIAAIRPILDHHVGRHAGGPPTDES